MKTYKEVKDIFQKPIKDAILVKEEGCPPRLIKKDFHKEEWQEYLKDTGQTKEEKKPKKTRKSKK